MGEEPSIYVTNFPYENKLGKFWITFFWIKLLDKIFYLTYLWITLFAQLILDKTYNTRKTTVLVRTILPHKTRDSLSKNAVFCTNSLVYEWRLTFLGARGVWDGEFHPSMATMLCNHLAMATKPSTLPSPIYMKHSIKQYSKCEIGIIIVIIYIQYHLSSQIKHFK